MGNDVESQEKLENFVDGQRKMTSKTATFTRHCRNFVSCSKNIFLCISSCTVQTNYEKNPDTGATCTIYFWWSCTKRFVKKSILEQADIVTKLLKI